MKMYVVLLSFYLLSGTLFVHCVIEYYYVNLKLSWEDARQYCREHYDDLATTEKAEDVNRLKIEAAAWIGLFDDPASWKGVMTSDSNSWRWSSTGTTSPGGYQNWATTTDPNNAGGNELCVYIQNGLWKDYVCTGSLHFFCYDVEPSGVKNYSLITTLMTWSNSQSYCRQHHHDLAMIETPAENQAVTNLLSTTTTSVWIGLYRIPWRWSNGSSSTYRKWAPGEPNNQGSEFCALQRTDYIWNDKGCTSLLPFVCQADKRTNVKTKITFQTTADMTDPACYDNFIKVLGNDLGSGFSLRWSILPTKKSSPRKTTAVNEKDCT